MVAWDQAKGKTATNNERREIQRIKLTEGPNKIRLVGDILPRYVYWVVTNEGRKMPVECLRFIREEESFDDTAKDPIKEVPEEVFDEKPQFAYVCNAIDRRDNQIKLFDLRSTIYRQMVDLAKDSDYGNPAHPDSGYDITVNKEKTGPLPQNVKYTCLPSRNNSPLTEEEKAMELYNLTAIFKRPTYAEQKKWLIDNTALFIGEAGDEFKETAEDLD